MLLIYYIKKQFEVPVEGEFSVLHTECIWIWFLGLTSLPGYVKYKTYFELCDLVTVTHCLN